MTMQPIELPVLGTATERADAARNRARILEAAARLFARDGVQCTSMDAIAIEAGVGKGTLFRRFGDRASLALALLESSERAFQDGFIRGAAPLGPGAPPCERLIAFGRSLLEHVACHADLMVAAETAGRASRRFDAGPYGAYHAHVSMLLAAADPELDPRYTADALLAPLSAVVVMHELRSREMPLQRLGYGWESLVRRVLRAPRTERGRKATATTTAAGVASGGSAAGRSHFTPF
ncbi:MAG: TetR/AcrR family transcriptional regulator [Solirubrobacteraceae bacterium]